MTRSTDASTATDGGRRRVAGPRPTMRRRFGRRTVGVAAVLAACSSFAILLSPAGSSVLPSAPLVPAVTAGSGVAMFPPAPNASTVPIQHVVIIMMENHAFDNFFGTYCPSVGGNCSYAVNGLPSGTCVPVNPARPTLGCIKPFEFPRGNSMYRDQPHSWNSSHQSYDGGLMDGFVHAEHSGNLTMGYWNGSTIPGDWVYAEQYGLGEQFFSSVLSYSLPNHWFALGGNAPLISESRSVQTNPGGPLTSYQETYLNESNATPEIDTPLVSSNISWKYYNTPLAKNYTDAINKHKGTGAFGYWNPFEAQAVAYQPNYSSHFVPRAQFLHDASNGTLPSVSWVIPDAYHSDHPPGNVTHGMQFLMQYLGAIEASPEWNSTVAFVTWDEYGGFYDHVAPPQIDAFGLGFRVPLLVVGPYIREGYVSDHLGYFESFMRLTEWKFGLTNLSTRDANAPLPLEYFDFSASPRPPLLLPNASAIRYPEQLQPLPAPPPVTNLTSTVGPGSVDLSWDPPVGGSAVTVYNLTYGPANNSTQFSVRVDGAADGYILTGIPANVSYNFSLSAGTPQNWSTATVVNATVVVAGPIPGLFTAVQLGSTLHGPVQAVPTRATRASFGLVPRAAMPGFD